MWGSIIEDVFIGWVAGDGWAGNKVTFQNFSRTLVNPKNQP